MQCGCSPASPAVHRHFDVGDASASGPGKSFDLVVAAGLGVALLSAGAAMTDLTSMVSAKRWMRPSDNTWV